MAEKKEKPAVKAEVPAKKGNAGGLRIGAVLLWVLALACEVLTVLIFNRTIYVEDEKLRTFLLGGIILDAVLVIIGAQLWKAANHKDPVSKKNKTKFWLWNNMGVIAAVVCFAPMIVLLLSNKDLDAKTKKLASIVAIIALLIAGVAGYDWNPVSEEDFARGTESAMAEYGDGSGSCYWTRYGKSYHLNRDCQTLTRTTESNLFSGSVEEAYEARRTDPCDFCAGGADSDAA